MYPGSHSCLAVEPTPGAVISQLKYRDRSDAGRRLAAHLRAFAGPDTAVFALPRGGVPVAVEVARALHLDVHLLFVRKLGVPWQPEVAFGALGEHGVCVLNRRMVAELGLSDERITEVQTAARAQLERAQTAFGSDRLAPAAVLPGTAIVVDDGIATGATVQAAIAVLRARGVATIVVAAPVASPDSARMLQAEADDVVVPLLPADFQAVGQYYRNFHQLSDDDVRACLADLRTSDSP